MAAFLKNLFTPKWQHSDAQVRLATLDTSTDVQVISTLAVDDNLDVRLKAISLLQENTLLAQLINDKNPDIKQAATQQFLAVHLGSHDIQQQLLKIEHVQDTQLLMTIATVMGNNELAQAALSNIQDEDQLVNFINQSASAKSRLLAMEKISQPERLKALAKQFKNKDKALTRLAKNKLSALLETEKTQQLATAHTNQLLSNALLLAGANFKPTYLAELTYVKQAWLKVDSSDSQKSDFAKAIKVCEQILLDNQQQQTELLTQQKNIQEAQELHKKALTQLQQIFEVCKAGTNIEASILAHDLKEACDIWQHASQLNTADSTRKKEFDALLKPLNALQSSLDILSTLTQTENKEGTDFSLNLKQFKGIELTIKKVNWPVEFPTGKQLHELEASLELKQTGLNEHRKNEKNTANSINTLLQQLEKDIEDGQLKSAKHTDTKIRKLLKLLPTQSDKSLNNKFQMLSSQLLELKDWQGYAAAPKFENLCAEMESLITAQNDPKQLSYLIHDLQDQWKALGGLPDKQQHQALWVRFKQASDTAYEPCKQYFQDLSKVKTYNKEQKEEICQQLESFFTNNDWPNADWPAIQTLLDYANSEFKKYSPVENSIHKALQSRFQAATKKIHGKVIGFYQENAQLKQMIIDQTKELQTQDDLAGAIETCKKLQQHWKTIDSAGRQEHSLWKTFREQCDALFNRRTAENQIHKEQLNAEKNQANALVEQAGLLLKSTNPDNLQQLKDLQLSLQQLDLPASIMESKNQQLNKVEEQIHQNKRNQKVMAQQQLWIDAMALSQQVAQWELEQQGDEEAITTLIQATKLPKGTASALQQRLSSKTSHTNDDYLKLCLALEITQDVDSPSIDQAARMALQVDRLQKNMGKKLPEISEQIESLQLDWFALSACSDEYLNFSARFNSALAK
jgi:exonuclease SbcC